MSQKSNKIKGKSTRVLRNSPYPHFQVMMPSKSNGCNSIAIIIYMPLMKSSFNESFKSTVLMNIGMKMKLPINLDTLILPMYFSLFKQANTFEIRYSTILISSCYSIVVIRVNIPLFSLDEYVYFCIQTKYQYEKERDTVIDVNYFLAAARLTAASWVLINSRYFSDLLNFSYSRCMV